MGQPRLKSRFLIEACIGLCSEKGIPVTVVKRGDPDAGVIYLKMNGLENGCIVLSQAYDVEEILHWVKTCGSIPITEHEADLFIERQIKYDNDIWVLEVEDKFHRNPYGQLI